MNKKAIESHLVIAIIILISFVVLIVLYKSLFGTLTTIAKDQQCFNSALANAYTKVAGVEMLKLDCDTHYLTMKEEDLNPDDAKKKWDMVYEITERSGKRAAFTLPYNKQGFYEYSLNEKVAKEMKSCWKRLGEGKLPLFDEWLRDNTKTGSKAVCVICSRIEFDSSVANLLGKNHISSLTEWLINNPSEQYYVGEPTRTLSMYEYVQDPDTYDPLISPQYLYDIDKSLAVVFSRTNRHAFSAWATELTQHGWAYTKEALGKLKDKITSAEAELIELENTQQAQQSDFKPQTDVRGWDLLLLIPYENVGDYCGYLGN